MKIAEVTGSRPSAVFHASWIAMLVLIAGLLAGAVFVPIDRVVRAEGEVRAVKASAHITSPASGRIQHVHVTEGDFVRKGETLIVIEPDYNGLSVANARIRLARNAAAYAAYAGTPLAVLPAAANEADAQEAARSSVEAEMRAGVARLHAADRDLIDAEAGVEVEAASLRRIVALEALARDKLDRHRKLVLDGFQSPVSLLLLEHEQVDLAEQSRVAQARLTKAQGDVERRRATLDALRAEIRKERANRLGTAHIYFMDAQRELETVEALARNTVIESPINGHVEQVSNNLAGNAVRAGDRLLLVVPEHTELEVHLRVRNEDYPYVQEGQSVEVKFDAFPYTVYGFRTGRVHRLSRDVLVDEKTAAEYAVVVHLDPAARHGSGIRLPIRPGMRVSANVLVGLRRPIEVWLDPFLRFTTESLRDR